MHPHTSLCTAPRPRRRPRRARGYIIATVGRSGSFHRALLHLGKHEADDHLAAVLGAEDLECVVGLAVAWLEQAHAAARTRSRIVERSVQPPLSRPFFRFYPVFDTGNSPAPQAISVTSKPNVATGGRAGPAAGSSGGRARPGRDRGGPRHARPRRDGAGTRSTRTDKYSILRYLSAVLGRFHLCFALCSRYSLAGEGARSC